MGGVVADGGDAHARGMGGNLCDVRGGDRDKRADRVLCDNVFEHSERFGDSKKVTDAFPLLGEDKRCCGGCGSRCSGAGAPWTKEALWTVFFQA